MASKLPAAGEHTSRHSSSLYEAMGGTNGCHKLATAFYARVARDPVLRPLFPGKSFRCAIDAFTAFLAQFLGGPSADAQDRWYLSLRESHLRFAIGQRERDAWIEDMIAALDDVPIAESVRLALLDFFRRSSLYLINRGSTSQPGSEAECPDQAHTEIFRRWEVQRSLDEAVDAIAKGDAPRAIALVESAVLQSCDPSVVTGLLASMIRSGHAALLDYVKGRITRDPSLVRERYATRTLLHEAAAAGNLAVVTLLLRLGANPEALDGGEHTPLYSVGNECRTPEGARVVRALVESGAKVDASEGAKRCTALHMAARRGSVEIAKALLDCGADLEARDSLGETPLRRAVNCNQLELAALLIGRGADIHSRDRKDVTPLLTARTAAMKQVLQRATRP